MKHLEDTDNMPIGKEFRDTPMRDVPAWHLRWWWLEKGKRYQVKTCPVADYINRNLSALKAEEPDAIWE